MESEVTAYEFARGNSDARPKAAPEHDSVRRLLLYLVLLLAACAPTVITARAMSFAHTGAAPLHAR